MTVNKIVVSCFALGIINYALVVMFPFPLNIILMIIPSIPIGILCVMGYKKSVEKRPIV